jgi:hypothetical protein
MDDVLSLEREEAGPSGRTGPLQLFSLRNLRRALVVVIKIFELCVDDIIVVATTCGGICRFCDIVITLFLG